MVCIYVQHSANSFKRRNCVDRYIVNLPSNPNSWNSSPFNGIFRFIQYERDEVVLSGGTALILSLTFFRHLRVFSNEGLLCLKLARRINKATFIQPFNSLGIENKFVWAFKLAPQHHTY